MKTILIPLDLGADTLALVNYAVPIAAQANATLLLLHVIRKQPYDNGTFSPETAVHQRMKQEAEINHETIARETLRHEILTKFLTYDGNPADAIIQCAKNRQADLIVMQRACGHETCTSEEVLRTAPCPVLTWMDTSQKSSGLRGKLSDSPVAQPA